jgi:hypothetical protein
MLYTYIIYQQMHIYKYVQSPIIILRQYVSVTFVPIIRVSYNKNTSIASKCTQNHFISEKHKMVPSSEIHFLQNILLV